MDYSQCSVLVVVVIVLVGGNNSIFSKKTEPILFKFGPYMQINKVGGNFFHDIDPKVKGQNQRSNISFCDKS